MGAVAYNVVGMLDGDAESTVYSSLDGPIESLSMLRRSLLFAELSNLSYLSRAEAGLLAYRIGFPEIRFYDRDGAQAYIFANDDDAVVTCRGTEPNDWNDVQGRSRSGNGDGRNRRLGPSRLQARSRRPLAAARAGAREQHAHAVVRRPLAGRARWPPFAPAAAGCRTSTPIPRALFTFGSPRVGNRRYVNYVQTGSVSLGEQQRHRDARAAGWLGYRHKGQEVYLNAYGKIRRLTPWQRVKDRWRGFVRGLREGRFDLFADHSIGQYVAAHSRRRRRRRTASTVTAADHARRALPNLAAARAAA